MKRLIVLSSFEFRTCKCWQERPGNAREPYQKKRGRMCGCEWLVCVRVCGSSTPGGTVWPVRVGWTPAPSPPHSWAVFNLFLDDQWSGWGRSSSRLGSADRTRRNQSKLVHHRTTPLTNARSAMGEWCMFFCMRVISVVGLLWFTFDRSISTDLSLVTQLFICFNLYAYKATHIIAIHMLTIVCWCVVILYSICWTFTLLNSTICFVSLIRPGCRFRRRGAFIPNRPLYGAYICLMRLQLWCPRASQRIGDGWKDRGGGLCCIVWFIFDKMLWQPHTM